MHGRLRLIVVACLMIHSSAAAIDKQEESALAGLLKVMREDMEAGKGKQGSMEESQQRMITLIEESFRSPAAGRGTLIQHLEDIESLFTRPDVKQAATKLLEEIRREETEAEAARIAEAEALIKRIQQAVKSAKEPSDLDELLADLSKRKLRRPIGQSEEVRNLYASLESAPEFVATWQNYLSAVKVNHSNEIRMALDTLLSGEKMDRFMPRSEILAIQRKYQPGTSEIIGIVTGIGSLEEIPAAMNKLRDVNTPDDYITVSNLIGPLSHLDEKYREWKLGLPVMLPMNWQGGNALVSEIDAKMSELRAEFMKLAIPRHVKAPEGTSAKPGETVVAFIDRLEEEAIKAEDPSLALRVRELQMLMSRGSSQTSVDLTGINSYYAAKNQEEAKQFELAVISYQQALKSGADLIPVKTIGARLEIIEQEHPAEYKAGMDRFLDPPPSRYEQSNRDGMPPGRTPSPAPAPPKEPAKAPAER